MRRYFQSVAAVSALLISGWASAQSGSDIEDRLAMLDVLARYSFAWDFADKNAFAELFTEDAVWEAYGFQADEPWQSYHGRDSILGFLDANHARYPDRKSAHHQSGLMVLEKSDSTARTQNMVIITAQGRSQPRPDIVASGVYYDTWTKTSEGWRIDHRILRIDGPAPPTE